MADCSALWQSKHQIETALLTMEAEVIAVAHSGKELLQIIGMVAALGKAVGHPKDLTTAHLSLHKDNAGSSIFAEMLPP